MINSRNVALGVFIYVLAILVFHLGAHAQETPTTPPATAEATPVATATPAATTPPAVPAPVVKKAPAKPKRFSKMYAKFETSLGNFTAILFHTQTPKTVANFVALVEGEKEWMDPKTQAMIKQPFYDGLIFHRVIKGFVIQGGDPLGLDLKRAGTGGPGFNIPEEFHRDLRFDKPGMLAMAKGNEISGSQFFITLANQERLDQPKPTYPIFGEITEGMDVVLKIGAVATDRRNDRPLDAVVIKKVTIVRK
jgi:peptidyl-prolyl cis-trans isomerase A (cyclophilin A)